MNHNNYKYQILLKSIPTDSDGSVLNQLLIDHGYPELIRCRKDTVSDKWIIFDGCKTSDLETIFDYYLELSPPSFMVETVNMNQDMAKQISRDTNWAAA